MNPYVVGFIAADGNVRKNSWVLTQNEEGLDALAGIVNEEGFGRIIPIKKSNGYPTEKKSFLLYCCAKNSSKELIKQHLIELVDWGVPIGNKTYTLKFPDKREAETWLYLRGFFDGDGCLSVSNGLSPVPRVQLISNHGWCIKASFFLRSQGVSCFVVPDKRHPQISQVVIGKRESLHRFMGQLYSDSYPLFMYRKHFLWESLRGKFPTLKNALNSRRDPLSAGEKKMILEELSKGFTIMGLARALHRSHYTIRDFLRNHTNRKTPFRLRQEMIVRKLLSQGFSGYAIRKMTGIHSRSIYGISKEVADGV